MSKEKKVELCAAEIMEVASDLMFCVIADDVTLTSHRLGACLSTLERVQYRLMSDILEQKDVLSLQDAKAQITALRSQIDTMQGGLAKVINKADNWEESYWTLREKFIGYFAKNPEIGPTVPQELLGPDRPSEDAAPSGDTAL